VFSVPANELKKQNMCHTKYLAFPKNKLAYGHPLPTVSPPDFRPSNLNGYKTDALCPQTVFFS